VVECLLYKCKALSSNPIPPIKERKKERKLLTEISELWCSDPSFHLF
jgi:hypothetical protein